MPGCSRSVRRADTSAAGSATPVLTVASAGSQQSKTSIEARTKRFGAPDRRPHIDPATFVDWVSREAEGLPMAFPPSCCSQSAGDPTRVPTESAGGRAAPSDVRPRHLPQCRQQNPLPGTTPIVVQWVPQGQTRNRRVFPNDVPDGTWMIDMSAS